VAAFRTDDPLRTTKKENLETRSAFPAIVFVQRHIGFYRPQAVSGNTLSASRLRIQRALVGAGLGIARLEEKEAV